MKHYSLAFNHFLLCVIDMGTWSFLCSLLVVSPAARNNSISELIAWKLPPAQGGLQLILNILAFPVQPAPTPSLYSSGNHWLHRKIHDISVYCSMTLLQSWKYPRFYFFYWDSAWKGQIISYTFKKYISLLLGNIFQYVQR